MIPHGAFDYLTRQPDEAPLPAELAAVDGPGHPRSSAWSAPTRASTSCSRRSRRVEGAELWVVGRPLGMPMEPLRELAGARPGTVRFVAALRRPTTSCPAFFRRADLVVLPYRDAEQSGVLYTALAFGKPMVLSDVGGFARGGARAAPARLVPPGDPEALRRRLAELLADDAAREALAAAAAAAAAGPYSWDARRRPQTMALYREPGAVTAARPIVFWVAAGLLVYTHLGYPLLLWALDARSARAGRRREPATGSSRASR